MVTIQITKRHVVTALSTVVVAGLLGTGWFYGRDILDPGAAAHESKPRDITLDLDAFVVNLSGDAGRYLRTSVTVAFGSERDKQIVKSASSRVRDGILLLLSGKTAEKLLAAEGKTELRDEIVERINTAVAGDVASTVYFREFLIQ
jgi:flagellar basal body-associated protein FliL